MHALRHPAYSERHQRTKRRLGKQRVAQVDLARDAAGLRPLRFHDLRQTYGSLLAAHGVDIVTIQAMMGHSAISTTSRYLHAKPATEQAEIFTRAFEPSAVSDADKLPAPART